MRKPLVHRRFIIEFKKDGQEIDGIDNSELVIHNEEKFIPLVFAYYRDTKAISEDYYNEEVGFQIRYTRAL